MTEKKLVQSLDYKGRKIEILAENVTQEVHIQGRQVAAARDIDTGDYYSPDAPYMKFGSLEELGKAIVDTEDEK